MSRWVNGNGRISLAGFDYVVGATFAGEPVANLDPIVNLVKPLGDGFE